MQITARDLKAGVKFPSPRAEEGVVTSRCDFGQCDHQDDRPDSVHVRDGRGSEFFIALIAREELHTCDEGCPSFLTPHTPEERDAHKVANYRQG